MESKNLFLFVFIFFINIKLLVCNEEYGTISFVDMNGASSSSEEQPLFDNAIHKCQQGVCTISFNIDFKDFQYFFSAYCEKYYVTSINLSNLKIIPNNLKGMFSGCYYLEKIEGLSRLNTSEVTDMSEMFAFCSHLSEIDLSNFDTSSVKDMSHMFYDVYSEIINVTNFNTSLVEDMSYMFAKDPEELPTSYHVVQKIIGLTNFDTSKVTSMMDMFDYCFSRICHICFMVLIQQSLM